MAKPRRCRGKRASSPLRILCSNRRPNTVRGRAGPPFRACLHAPIGCKEVVYDFDFTDHHNQRASSARRTGGTASHDISHRKSSMAVISGSSRGTPIENSTTVKIDIRQDLRSLEAFDEHLKPDIEVVSRRSVTALAKREGRSRQSVTSTSTMGGSQGNETPV